MSQPHFSPGSKTVSLTRGAVIAALYAALTVCLYPISFGAVQLRISEALCVLPVLFPEAIPGLFVGCIVGNLVSPGNILLDVTVGGTATLLAALVTRAWRKHPVLAPLPAVVCNALMVGAVVTVSVTGTNSAAFAAAYLYNALTVGLGELCVVYGAGLPLLLLLMKLQYKHHFPMP